jgi:membrane-bound ClpP family serine protease
MLRKSVEVTNQSSFDDLAAVSRTATSVVTTADIFNVVLGTIFLVYAAYRPSNSFVAVLGAAFIAFGLFGLVRRRLASRKSKSSPTGPQ